MKILSWNIWVDGYFDQIRDFLSTADADILGLQEVKDNDPERDAIGYLTQLGYQHIFARIEQKWDGMEYKQGPAVFSRLPIIHSETHLLDEEDQRAVARADVDVNGTTLHVFSTHLLHTHQKPSARQDAQVKRLLELLPRERTVVMGDFNATPDSSAVRAMTEVLNDTDPTSTPTWSVYPEGCRTCRPQTVDTRLDYIFASKDLKITSFEVGKSGGSDHLPISVNVELN